MSEQHQDFSLLLKLLDMKGRAADLATGKEAEERHERFKTDIAGFCKYYFPHYVKLEMPLWQKLIFSIFENVKFNDMGKPYWTVTEKQAKRLALLHRPEFRDIPKRVDLLKALVLCAPREQGKSTVFARMLIIWALLYGYFRFIVIIRSSGEIAGSFLADSAAEFEDNPRLIEDYGNLRGSVWKNGQYALKNGAVMVSVGRGASVRGLVSREKRPDCIILDDITTDEDKNNIFTLNKIYDWIFSAVVNLGKDALKIFLNTIFNSRDPQARILDRIRSNDLDGYLGLRFSAEIEDGVKALWPEYWPIEALKSKKKEVGTRTYMIEYQSITLDDTGKTFKSSDFHWIPESKIDIREYDISFGVDPNAEGSDDAAVCVLGRHRRTGHYLTLELWAKDFCKINELVDTIVRFWRKYSPLVIGFENVNFQHVYMKLLQEILLPQNLALPFIGIDAPGSKEARAIAIQPFMENGTWEFAEHIQDSSEYLKLKAFPSKGVNDGTIDALGLAYRAFNRSFAVPVGASGGRRTSELPNLINRYVGE